MLSPVASERKLDNGRVVSLTMQTIQVGPGVVVRTLVILFVGIIVGVLFLRWINNHSANICPVTVVSIVETLRDAIMARYSIEPEEFINR